MTWTINH